jgi:hypothetical protein
MNDVAKFMTLIEGGKVEISIGQMKEVLRRLNLVTKGVLDFDLYKLLKSMPKKALKVETYSR